MTAKPVCFEGNKVFKDTVVGRVIKTSNKGFTIIEVLIVLAIAGLIMSIVFLAIPALQRRQRNTARNSEASRVSAAVTQCLVNRNSVVSACTATSINAGQLQQLDGGVAVVTAISAINIDTNRAYVIFGHTCDSAGANPQPISSPKSFAVVYGMETGRTATVGKGATPGNLSRCLN